MSAHEGRGTHPLVTWGVREPTTLLASPGQVSKSDRGSNTFPWRHLETDLASLNTLSFLSYLAILGD